tara:strand:- start:72 stop:287 length:216 start_codon:yes stop_codon:yes gene_type:complete
MLIFMAPKNVENVREDSIKMNWEKITAKDVMLVLSVLKAHPQKRRAQQTTVLSNCIAQMGLQMDSLYHPDM